MATVPALVVAGPSGVGKGTLLKMIRARYGEYLEFTISCTTRAPREGEVDGKDYYFITKEEFEKRVQDNQFLEHATFAGNRYGTGLSEIARVQRMGNKICLIEIELNGVQQLQKNPNVLAKYVFLYPPSTEALAERLRLRGTESEETIQRRLETGRQEIEIMDQLTCNHKIVNVELQDAYKSLCEYVESAFDFIKIDS
ncbi:guanylate kinase [Gregarina niphandrodes]|uniref:guanylate kinase n=1 Tax=Gregarina niphandrodes TaxID=110365 RepID=A0A023B0Y6_GRENI|nr:guanylate kinase [Gregarina niphandrodes]EZG46154.1 guanylate kinase [Gregarina niphandrodes]|eukprot:XP_011132350.1 guanylate kinase [Gregarina niphandrodes]